MYSQNTGLAVARKRRPRGGVVLPAPTAEISPFELIGPTGHSARPVLIDPWKLRRGLRIGRRILIGATAVRWTLGRGAEHYSGHWEPVTVAKGCHAVNDLRWLTRCDCGTERYVHLTSLITGGALSCGCYRTDRCAYLAAVRAQQRAELAARKAVA